MCNCVGKMSTYSYHIHNLPLEVINAEVIPKVGFGTFRYDRYAEEDFFAVKLNYSQLEVDNT